MLERSDYQAFCTLQQVLDAVWPSASVLDVRTVEMDRLILADPVLRPRDVRVVLGERRRSDQQARVDRLLSQIVARMAEIGFQPQPFDLVDKVRADLATTFFRDLDWSAVRISPFAEPLIDRMIERIHAEGALPENFLDLDRLPHRQRIAGMGILYDFAGQIGQPAPRPSTAIPANPLGIPSWLIPESDDQMVPDVEVDEHDFAPVSPGLYRSPPAVGSPVVRPPSPSRVSGRHPASVFGETPPTSPIARGRRDHAAADLRDASPVRARRPRPAAPASPVSFSQATFDRYTAAAEQELSERPPTSDLFSSLFERYSMGSHPYPAPTNDLFTAVFGRDAQRRA